MRMLSSPALILIVVLVPFGFFGALFALAILHRRLNASHTHAPAGMEGPCAPPNVSDIPCHHCPRTQPANALLATISPQTQGLTAHDHPAPLILDQARRESSFSQPHFAETSLSVRRVSTHPQQDTVSRVNSIASTLIESPDPHSDSLPYGGRKSSVSSIWLASQFPKQRSDAIGLAERVSSVPSASGGGEDTLNLRRVSAGGAEDIVPVHGLGVARASSADPTFGSMALPLAQIGSRQPVPPHTTYIPGSPIKSSRPVHNQCTPSAPTGTPTGIGSRSPLPVSAASMAAMKSPMGSARIAGSRVGEGGGMFRDRDFPQRSPPIMPPVHQLANRPTIGETRSKGKITYLADVVVRERRKSVVVDEKPPVIPMPEALLGKGEIWTD